MCKVHDHPKHTLAFNQTPDIPALHQTPDPRRQSSIPTLLDVPLNKILHSHFMGRKNTCTCMVNHYNAALKTNTASLLATFQTFCKNPNLYIFLLSPPSLILVFLSLWSDSNSSTLIYKMILRAQTLMPVLHCCLINVLQVSTSDDSSAHFLTISQDWLIQMAWKTLLQS